MPVFQDRASAKAKMTSDELDTSSDDEKESPASNDSSNISDGNVDSDNGDANRGSVGGDDNGSGSVGGDGGNNCGSNRSTIPSGSASARSSSTSTHRERPVTKKKKRDDSTRPRSIAKKKKGGDKDGARLGTYSGQLNSWMVEINDKKAKKLDELVRHNKAMEATQDRHNTAVEEHNKAVQDQAKWKTNNEELEYKCNLMDKYMKLKRNKISKKTILKMIPAMKDITDDDDSSDV